MTTDNKGILMVFEVYTKHTALSWHLRICDTHSQIHYNTSVIFLIVTVAFAAVNILFFSALKCIKVEFQMRIWDLLEIQTYKDNALSPFLEEGKDHYI